MFRFRKTLDIVTLFHKAGSPASLRAATVLKQASANATEAATEDQASTHRADFELQVTEDPPTAGQLETILQYVGKNKIGSVIKGASTEDEALKRLREDTDNLQRPLIVDWNNGRAIVSSKESEILKMLDQLNGK
ncbi:DUF1687-domain-containing protein [Xylaria sp. FL1777]|nr:DUF1687-domain-containing protein [Xylaria sp. FL1777]